MTDNSTLPVAVGTEVFANKDMSGVKYPKQIPSDGTNLITIKPASTPPSTTDTGQVMHIHPLSQNPNGQAIKASSAPVVLPSDPDTRTATTNIGVSDAGSSSTTGQNGAAVITGTPNAGSFASWAVNGSALTRIQLSGTWAATIAIEGSADGGTTWGLKTALVSGTALTSTVTSVTGNGQFDVLTAGLTNVRVRCTAFTSGTAVAQATITSATGAIEVLNPIRIIDGTSGASLTIKPASTSATSADPAVVVTAASLPLPTGAALEAGNLAAIVTNTGAALPAGTNVIGGIFGDVSIGGSDATNPVKVGAVARNVEPSALVSGQRATFYTDLVGKHIVLPYANPENFVSGTTSAITNTSSTAVIAAQAAGVRTYVTSFLVTNSHATVGTFVQILDGSTVLWQGWAAAAGGGFAGTLPAPLRGSAATALNAQCVTTGANVIVNAAGYKGV